MNRDQYDAILGDAIQGEIEAQNFYKEAAEKLSDPFLKDLFQGFVNEEKKHQNILEGFRSSMPETLPFDENRDYKVAETVDDTQELSTDMKPADAFALAMKKEEHAMKRYTNLAEGATDAEQKKIFRDLAAMERDHKRKMENAFVDVGYPELW